ncbi:capsular polysaccharide biosynthesis protein [Scopulibacillus darangshiensis]|uniref:Capsular polysaccharide biosynthesis protein n=1 Tax=Scopulibacillus darangshiensis TaxID=442528 RepID=A0A4R2NSJ1_9BACL|nr:Wzz/FepE/Etk N-terminal domain-containing protein [Scopulibacillus darangshiensis]TCP24929.1 capsular polysaccharide biosynthesis protein [Scopulibacillus darangshiensis]
MEETISLKEIFQTLRKRLAMILVITILAAAVSAAVTYFVMTPKYNASTQILVNQSDSKESVYDTNSVQTNVQLINTYSVIIKSPTVLKKVVSDLNLDMTPDQLKGILSVSSEQDSQVFTVTVESTKPAEAATIANSIASVFKEKIQKIMKVDNVSILSKAQVTDNPAPVSPKPLLNMAIAFVVGLMVSVGLAFLLEYLDNTVKTEEDIEKLLELPVLGAITEINGNEQKVVKQDAMQQQVRSDQIEA